MSRERIYGVAELAEACGVEPRRVAAWLVRGSYDIPAPDVRLRATPIWYASTIEAWIRERLAG